MPIRKPFKALYVVAMHQIGRAHVWIRWSLPRFRIDKVMYLCYKVLLPWSVICVVGIALQVLLAGSLPDSAFASWLMGR